MAKFHDEKALGEARQKAALHKHGIRKLPAYGVDIRSHGNAGGGASSTIQQSRQFHDAESIYRRAVEKGIPPAKAESMARKILTSRQTAPYGVYAVTRPGGQRQPQINVHEWQAPTVAPPLSPESQPGMEPGVDQSDEYRWAQVLTKQEYRDLFGTERDVSPEVAYQPAAGEAIRIIYGPHPTNHEGHLRKNGKPCGHWVMQIYLVGTQEGDFLGLQFASGYRCYYPSKGESDYHAALNAESTSYWAWDNGIRTASYTPF